MAATVTSLEDLYRGSRWANGRLLNLCQGLSEEQLDAPRPMGFGSLRNTLFHILAAEEAWLDRWESLPWRPFPTNAQGLSLTDIQQRLEAADHRRQQLIDRERGSGWSRLCTYRDAQGTEFTFPLNELLLHVANHGVHHRAQALNYLKQLERTVPGGLDYIFFRLARPHHTQEVSTAQAMRQFGLEIGEHSGDEVMFDASLLQRYFQYGDWANARALTLMDDLAADVLDRECAMGMNTIRKTMLHLLDAERWWIRNWTSGPSAFERLPASTSVAEMRSLWGTTIQDRSGFLAAQTPESARQVVTASSAGMLVRVAVVESLLQLCWHGTHHRAQLINMLRQTGISLPGFDYIVKLRESV